jgi:peptidoglycan/xylan/chitin deacetylase (PgdA/CDA1 family)
MPCARARVTHAPALCPRLATMANSGGTAAVAAAGIAVASIAVAQAGPGLTGLGPVRRSIFPRLAGEGSPGHVALTFDDGPDPGTTPGFARLLADRRVRATFFLLGGMVARTPALAADLAAAGHEIGVHGWEHRYLPPRGPLATFDDIRRATDVIAGATGTRPRLFRPPYGVLSGAALLAARNLGLTPVLGLRQPDGSPARRGHRPAARLRLHVAPWVRPRGPGRAALAARRVRAARAGHRAGRRARAVILRRAPGEDGRRSRRARSGRRQPRRARDR